MERPGTGEEWQRPGAVIWLGRAGDRGYVSNSWKSGVLEWLRQDAFRVGPCRAPPVKAPGLRRRRQEARGKSAADAIRSQQPFQSFSEGIRKARHFSGLRILAGVPAGCPARGTSGMASRKLLSSQGNREAPQGPSKPSGIGGGREEIPCIFPYLALAIGIARPITTSRCRGNGRTRTPSVPRCL